MLSPWPCGGCRDLTVSPLKNERIHREKGTSLGRHRGQVNFNVFTSLRLCNNQKDQRFSAGLEM